MKNILITGGSGYFGSKLAQRFCAMEGVERVVSLDIKAPAATPEKLLFVRADARQPLDDIFAENGIDTVVHAAWVLPPIHDKGLMEDINLGGTTNVLEASRRAGARRFFYTSSATAYGFHADNQCPLTEDSPLRGNDDFTYSKTKRIVEGLIAEFAARNPAMTVCWARPCFVVGPGFNNPLARHLQKRLAVLPRPSAAMQFVHEDDLTRAIVELLRAGARGPYNVGASGVMTTSEMVRALGGRPLPVPVGLLRPLNALAWALRLGFITEFPSPALKLMQHPWVVDSGKLERELGFAYAHDTRQAFAAFAEHVKAGRKKRRS